MNGIFVAALSSFVGFLFGFMLFKRQKERELYYFGATKLCSTLINNISYKADKISSVINSFDGGCVSLKKNLNEFRTYLGGGEFKMSENCLTASEANTIKEFLLGLGKYDGETQLMELNRCEAEFKARYGELKAKNDKQGNMYIKLGLLFGLLVGILLL